MNFLQRNAHWIALVALVCAIIGIYTPVGQTVVGVVGTRFPNGVSIGTVAATQGKFNIGNSGTAVANLNMGTCYIKPYATTITASSTAIVDCQGTAAVGSITGVTSALTGVTLGDFVQIMLSTTTAGTSANQGELIVAGASASTTAGYITLTLYNATGGTYTWGANQTAASGTASYISSR